MQPRRAPRQRLESGWTHDSVDAEELLRRSCKGEGYFFFFFNGCKIPTLPHAAHASSRRALRLGSGLACARYID